MTDAEADTLCNLLETNTQIQALFETLITSNKPRHALMVLLEMEKHNAANIGDHLKLVACATSQIAFKIVFDTLTLMATKKEWGKSNKAQILELALEIIPRVKEVQAIFNLKFILK